MFRRKIRTSPNILSSLYFMPLKEESGFGKVMVMYKKFQESFQIGFFFITIKISISISVHYYSSKLGHYNLS